VAVSGRYGDWREPKTAAPDRQEDAQYDESTATANESVNRDQQQEFCAGMPAFSLSTSADTVEGSGCGTNPLR
jgi:hypothetical protein